MAETSTFRPFPPLAALGFAALIGSAILVAAAGRYTGTGVVQEQPAQVVASRSLQFDDAGAGLVLVKDVTSGDLVAELAPGTENFIRGVLRTFARERRATDVDRAISFTLRLEADDTLSIVDDATGRRVNLNAFGPTNREAFARLLVEGRTAP